MQTVAPHSIDPNPDQKGVPMAFETLLVAREGKIVTVTLNRPKQLNAINLAMMRELDEVAAGL